MTKSRILIVESEPLTAQDLTNQLRRHGFRIAGVAASGREAIRKARRLKPDAILMELILPGEMDGIQAMERIREKGDLPVVYLTDGHDDAVLRRAEVTHACGILFKPYLARELAWCMRLAIKDHQRFNELIASRATLQTIIDGLDEGVLLTDTHSHILTLNLMAAELTGRPAENAIGRSLQEVLRLTEKPAAPATAVAKLESDTDLSMQSTDGTPCIVAPRNLPINGADGQIRGVLVVLRDVTAERERMQHIIEEHKMAAISALASNLSRTASNLHKLIRVRAEAMLDYLPNDSRARQDTEGIVSAVDRVGALTRQVASVARASGHAAEHTPLAPVQLSDAVNTAIELVRTPFDAQNIKIEVHLAEQPPIVQADSVDLGEVIVNLLFTAADAMPKGGVIAIEVRRQHVLRPDLKANPRARPGEYAVLRVHNANADSTNEPLPKPGQAPSTAKSSEFQSDLGLTLIQQVTLRCGGWVRTTSDPDRGTTMALYFPVSTESARTSPRRHAMVIDDDLETCREMATHLEDAGIAARCLTQRDAVAAQLQASANRTELFVLDAMYGGMPASTLIESLYAINPTANLLLVSGFSRELLRARLPHGPWRFLQKPFDREQFQNAVHRILEPKTI
ncbi:MAG: response regulator [bacterium]